MQGERPGKPSTPPQSRRLWKVEGVTPGLFIETASKSKIRLGKRQTRGESKASRFETNPDEAGCRIREQETRRRTAQSKEGPWPARRKPLAPFRARHPKGRPLAPASAPGTHLPAGREALPAQGEGEAGGAPGKSPPGLGWLLALRFRPAEAHEATQAGPWAGQGLAGGWLRGVVWQRESCVCSPGSPGRLKPVLLSCKGSRETVSPPHPTLLPA